MELFAGLAAAAGVVLLVVVVALVKQNLARRFLDDQATTPLAELHPYVMASISGDGRDVINVALSELVRHEALVPAADQQPRLRVAPPSPHPLEEALLRCVGRGTALSAVAADPDVGRALRTLHTEAQGTGWVRTLGSARRLIPWQLVGAVLIVVASAATVWRWPVPGMVVVAVGLLSLGVFDSTPLRPGTAGRLTLQEQVRLREHLAQPLAAPSDGASWSAELAERVRRAVVGSGFDQELAEGLSQERSALLVPAPPRRGSTSNGGGSGGCGAGSCGGGSCGGGGCGGGG